MFIISSMLSLSLFVHDKYLLQDFQKLDIKGGAERTVTGRGYAVMNNNSNITFSGTVLKSYKYIPIIRYKVISLDIIIQVTFLQITRFQQLCYCTWFHMPCVLDWYWFFSNCLDIWLDSCLNIIYVLWFTVCNLVEESNINNNISE